jgi:hypothetical protein
MNCNMHVNNLIAKILEFDHSVYILLFIMIQECLFIFEYLFIGMPIMKILLYINTSNMYNFDFI